jgi:hypothetical protein
LLSFVSHLIPAKMDLNFNYNPCSVLLQGLSGSMISGSQEDPFFVLFHTWEEMKQSFIFALGSLKPRHKREQRKRKIPAQAG